MTRLGGDLLDRIPLTAVVDRERLSPGIVHLGIGAFYRAHGALYTQTAIAATGDHRWGIVAATQRSRTAYEQLQPQDGYYTVTERGVAPERTQLVSVLTEIVAGPDDPAAVLSRIASPQTHVVTLTITEKGYHLDPRTGGLDLDSRAIRADLAGTGPSTAIGQLGLGLLGRRLAGSGPLTVLSCDNLHANGRLTRRLVTEFVRELPVDQSEPLLAWIEEHVTFPSSMVDRMVPATTRGDLDALEARLGIRDEAAVFTEPFLQWVIEDDFAGPRPAWELAGAHLTDTVEQWEQAKLQLLNASHSLVAYLGLLTGYRTIADAVADLTIRSAAEHLMAEAVEVLQAPEGFDPESYCASVIERFRNPALGHTVAKVGSDGSQKLGPRVLSTVAGVLAAGDSPRWAALAVAAWMRYVVTSTERGAPVDDPLADRLREAVPAGGTPEDVVAALLSTEVFDRRLTSRPGFTEPVLQWYRILAAGEIAAIIARG